MKSFLFIALVAVSLFACGGPGSSTGTDSTTPSADTMSAPKMDTTSPVTPADTTTTGTDTTTTRRDSL